MHIDNSGRVARGGSFKRRDGPYRASQRYIVWDSLFSLEITLGYYIHYYLGG